MASKTKKVKRGGPISRADAYDREEKAREAAEEPAVAPAPIPMRLHCPACNRLHVDEGEFTTKPHHTHACQHCGNTWRPAIENTVGVEFLPGFKNASDAPATRGCGCGMAGIGVFNDNHEIQCCDECALFETDDDAANAVEHLLKLLHEEYERGGTVADAHDRLAAHVEVREALRAVVDLGGEITTKVYKRACTALKHADEEADKDDRCPECGERGHTASECDMEG